MLPHVSYWSKNLNGDSEVDMIDILGGMLGQKSSRPSGKKGSSKGGTDILADIFGGRSKRSSAPSSSDLESQAKELEDLLNVSNEHHRGQSRSRTPPRSGSPGAPPTGSTFPGSSFPGAGSGTRVPAGRPHSAPASNNDRAQVLVHAMINAAKADGQIDPAEQQSILQQFDGRSNEAVQFLREEFQKPLNLQQFAASVPVGMEQQVYAMSLMCINLDTGEEAKYLMELSQALRLPADVREQIHQRFGAPSIY